MPIKLSKKRKNERAIIILSLKRKKKTVLK